LLTVIIGILIWTIGLSPATGRENLVKVYTQKDGLTGDTVTAIAASGGLVCAASNYVVIKGMSIEVHGGISIFKPLNGTWKSYGTKDGLPSEIAQCLAIQGRYVWVGTNKGVSRFDPRKVKWDAYSVEDGLPDNSVNSIAFDGEKVWVGTNKGVCVFDPQTRALSTPGELASINWTIHGIAIYGEEVWLATTKGVILTDASGTNPVVYTKDDGLPTDLTTAIAADASYVWVGTSKALACYDRQSKRWLTVGQANGLPTGKAVRALFLRDGRIWVCITNSGVAYADVKKGELPKFTTLTDLPSKDPTSIAIQGRNIWVGTDKGLARFRQSLPSTVILAYVGIVGIIAAALIIGLRGRISRALTSEKGAGRPKAAPPDEACGGNPSRNLCLRCKFLTVKENSNYCSKYEKPVEIETKRLRQR